MKIVNTPKQRVFFRHTALNFLAIRQILQRAHRAPVQNHRAGPLDGVIARYGCLRKFALSGKKNSLLLGISPIIKQALDAAYIICEFADTEYDRYLEYHLK